jgi:hypothetical protein
MSGLESIASNEALRHFNDSQSVQLPVARATASPPHCHYTLHTGKVFHGT